VPCARGSGARPSTAAWRPRHGPVSGVRPSVAALARPRRGRGPGSGARPSAATWQPRRERAASTRACSRGVCGAASAGLARRGRPSAQPRRGFRRGARCAACPPAALARPLRSPCPSAAPCQRLARPVWHAVCSPGVTRRGARCSRHGPTWCAGCPTRPVVGMLVPRHGLRGGRLCSPDVVSAFPRDVPRLSLCVVPTQWQTSSSRETRPINTSRPKPVCVEPISHRGENTVYPSPSTHARSPSSPSWCVRAACRSSRVVACDTQVVHALSRTSFSCVSRGVRAYRALPARDSRPFAYNHSCRFN
jgi:hypothetical protein